MKFLFTAFKLGNRDVVFWLLLSGLFLGLVFIFFYRLGIHPLIDWDESIYAQVAREALSSHRYLDFTYLGKFWFEKPPLVIWLTAASFRMSGLTELAARVPVALSALLTVALSCFLAWRLFRSQSAVLLTVGVYYISFPFITAAYFLNFDTIVGLFILLSVGAFWLGRSRPNYYYWFGLALSLGVMTKSVVGLFPLAGLFLYSLGARDFGFLRKRQFYYGLILSAVIILPWHIYQSWHYGHAFWDNYFLYHVWSRFTTALEYNGAPFGFYWDILRQYLVFFGLLLISLGYFAVQSFRRSKFFYVLATAAGLFLVLSFARTKLPSYLVIVYPYLTIMIAVTLAHFLALCRFAYLRYISMAVLLGVFVFYGQAFNSYKLAKGESDLVLADDKRIGQYLAVERRDLPVYISNPAALRNAIAFYANRPVMSLPGDIPSPLPADLQSMKPLTRTHAASLYLVNNYLYIVK